MQIKIYRDGIRKYAWHSHFHPKAILIKIMIEVALQYERIVHPCARAPVQYVTHNSFDNRFILNV